jgi:hypothetical protein
MLRCLSYHLNYRQGALPIGSAHCHAISDVSSVSFLTCPAFYVNIDDDRRRAASFGTTIYGDINTSCHITSGATTPCRIVCAAPTCVQRLYRLFVVDALGLRANVFCLFVAT